ncbi:Divalent metal cation transporter MntH [Diplonema papillatum]|nr:Divalent metal cation transporter MntH [Diplonema papillatum]
MEEGHYAPVSFGSRSNSPEVGNASTKLLDWEHASYGTEEVRVSINTGSGQMKRMGSAGYKTVRTWLALYGPGLVVMLASADAGSLVTAAEVGKVWGFAMLLWQLLLAVPLYMTQELTVRLGAASGIGHAELICQRYGKAAGVLCGGVVVITCVGTIIAQMTVLVGIAEAAGFNPTALCLFFVAAFSGVMCGGHAAKVEKICLILGLCEVAFFVSMVAARPSPSDMVVGFLNSMNFGDSSFSYLLAANVGSVISPWMMFYEQAAVVDKQLTIPEVSAGRKDVLAGAVLCQCIISAITLTAAARAWGGIYDSPTPEAGFSSVEDVVTVLSPFPNAFGRELVTLGFIGSALNATLVVSVTAVWVLAEVFKLKKGTQSFVHHTVREQPVMYALFVIILCLGSFLSLVGVDLIALNVAVNILNTLLLPISLGFLLLLASDPDVLPPALLLTGTEKRYYILVFFIIGIGPSLAMLG